METANRNLINKIVIAKIYWRRTGKFWGLRELRIDDVSPNGKFVKVTRIYFSFWIFNFISDSWWKPISHIVDVMPMSEAKAESVGS